MLKLIDFVVHHWQYLHMDYLSDTTKPGDISRGPFINMIWL